VSSGQRRFGRAGRPTSGPHARARGGGPGGPGGQGRGWAGTGGGGSDEDGARAQGAARRRGGERDGRGRRLRRGRRRAGGAGALTGPCPPVSASSKSGRATDCRTKKPSPRPRRRSS